MNVCLHNLNIQFNTQKLVGKSCTAEFNRLLSLFSGLFSAHTTPYMKENQFRINAIGHLLINDLARVCHIPKKFSVMVEINVFYSKDKFFLVLMKIIIRKKYLEKHLYELQMSI